MNTESVSKMPGLAYSPIKLDFAAMLVVYETEDGFWRGFAAPYGETTEGNTKEEALLKIRELTDAYFDVAKKYGYPSHLVNNILSDQADRDVYTAIVATKAYMDKLHSREGVAADIGPYYAEAYRVRS